MRRDHLEDKRYQQTWRQSIPSRPQLTASAITCNKGSEIRNLGDVIWFTKEVALQREQIVVKYL